jgi:hypothetical protein
MNVHLVDCNVQTGEHGKNKLQKQDKYISYKISKTNSRRSEGKNTQ